MEKTHDFVMVEWTDSVQADGSWCFLSELEDLSAAECQTVGWLLQDTESVAIAQTRALPRNKDEGQVCGVMTIPRCSITKITKINLDE